MPIDTDENLFRRAYLDVKYSNRDGTATSRVFKLRLKDEGKLSVDISSLTTPERSISNSEKFILFEIRVFQVETIGLAVEPDPLPDNPAHAVILGMDENDDIKPGLLARASRRVII